MIKHVHAREILDSRGNPTVEVEVKTSKGIFRADVPSGASTGIHEAKELRDHNPERYGGKGVLVAISKINNIIGPLVIGRDVTDQKGLDDLLCARDGTENKANLGANSILGVSLAVARAGAAEKGVPLYRHLADLAGNQELVLPLPAFNVINGGEHAGNSLAMQEFKIMPIGAPSFKEALRYASEIYHKLKELINHEYGLDATNVGDEGGFAPNLSTTEEGLTLLKLAIEKAGYKGKVAIGIDAAASSFFVTETGMYDLNYKRPTSPPQKNSSGEELIQLYQRIVQEFPVVSIEDPFDEDDWNNHVALTSLLGKQIQIIGDDLLVTNPHRIRTGIDKGACNCLLLKLNQIGTVSEAIEACKMAQKAGWNVMVSHRSGETEDSFIADLAVGLGAGQIKSGAPCRSERLVKYNQLLRIEEELGDKAVFAGKKFFSCWKF